MQLAPIVSRITAQVPALQKVAVAASIEAIVASLTAYPCAYLLAPRDKASENTKANALSQLVGTRFSIALVCQNLSDMRGEAALAEMDALRPQVWAALLNWVPGTGYRPVELTGGALLHAADGLVVWADEFFTDVTHRVV